MGRQITFKAELKRIIDENSNVGSRKAIESTPLQIVIRVQNNEKEYFYDWSPEKFDNRFASIMDQWKDFMDSELPPIYNSLDEDPFFDYPQANLIGTAFIDLDCLLSQSRRADYYEICDIATSKRMDGKLQMQIVPLNSQGQEEILDGEATDGEKRFCKFAIIFRRSRFPF